MYPLKAGLRALAALVIVAGFGLVSGAPAPLALAQTPAPPTPQYFPQTGHTVQSPFLDYFNATGAVARHGYPLTEQFADPQSGLLVQYFQNSRIESHPGNEAPYKIQLGLLGEQLGKRQPPIPVNQIAAFNNPNCFYFQETGHGTCYRFLQYWQDRGSVDQFAYPITPLMIENNRIVQYFQRVRLEWYPDKPEGQRVQIAALGQEYFDYARLDRNLLKPVPPPGPPGQNVISLRARATMSNFVIGRGATQVAFVSVTDQLGNPISGAAVTMVVNFPAGAQTFTLPPTDNKGTSRGAFVIGNNIPAGTVVPVEFIIVVSGFNADTRTSFLVWYF